MTENKKVESVFDSLASEVADLAKSRFGKPTAIQEKAIPKILEGKNVLVIAPTGLGKTEAVMLPIFSGLVENKYKPIAVLYITPLRALNRDLLERLLWWSNKLGFGVTVRHGDTTQHERTLQREHPDELFITTPEQLQAMLTGKRLREHLSNIKFVIVDELHELIESKRGTQLAVAIERLKQLCKPQIIALSATIGSPDTAKNFLGCEEIVKATESKDFEIIVESPLPSQQDKQIAEKIFIGSDVAARLSRIHELMKQYRSVLAFTNTREAAEILSSRLRVLDKEFPHDVHHSSLSKEVRIKTEKDFKAEKLKALIATSSLELGIDIGSIDLVLQYQSPRQVTKLTQRVGRSGHGVGRKSQGIIIAGEADDIFESAVIARKALCGELEKLLTHKNALDVLAHQIVGVLMEKYEVDVKEIFNIVRGSYPFLQITEGEALDVIRLLEQLKLVWLNEYHDKTTVKRRRKAFEYYFENLSTIPDTYQYKIIDATLNQAVGTLDEQFVAEHNEPGTTFIVKGRPWRVVSVDNEKVYVEAVDDIESAIPAWEGELIPVPYAVAQEVAELREKIEKLLGLKDTEIVEKIKSAYPLTTQAAVKMLNLIKKQSRKNAIVPKANEIVFETYEDYTLMHCCFGTKVNETLARFISTILSAERGHSVATRVDPYRIIFRGASIGDIKKVLQEYKPDDVEPLLEKSLPRSSLFKWKFVFVAKRFGAIAKKAKYDKINIDKIIDVYYGSPLHKETLRELFLEKLDVEKAKEILEKIQKKQILLKEQSLSPLGEIGFRYELHDVAKPARAEAEIFSLFKQRLLKTKLRLLCVNCGKYSLTTQANDTAQQPRCLKCSSRLIAALRPHQTEAQVLVKKRLAGKPISEEELHRLERIKWSAELVLNYGKRACIALAGRGVGPQTAMRLLARQQNDEKFYKDILAAERQFIKTKRYWS